MKSAIIDGEAVVLDERGGASFQALQQALGGRSGTRHAKEAILYAFDLLYLDGHDLRALPLDDRRALLLDLLEGAPSGLRFSEELDLPGAELLGRACALRLEASSPSGAAHPIAQAVVVSGRRSNASSPIPS